MTSNNADFYFGQTLFGESRWWSWLSTMWIAIVLWVILSTILGIPMFIIGLMKNPEVANQLIELSTAQQAEETAFVSTLKAIVGITTFGGILTWCLRFATKGTMRSGLNITTGVFMALSTVCAIAIYPSLNNPEVNAVFMPMVGESAVVYALMLMTFPAFLAGLYFCQKIIHRRTIMSIHTAASKIDWKRIVFAIGVTWAVIGSLTILAHITGISPVRSTFDPSRFFAFAFVTLIFIPLQSGTEEIIFRGYLNQAFGHFISNKWFVFIITSAMFAAMHLSNPEALSGAEKGGFTHLLVMSQYFLFGFVLSVIVYFEGGLEAAIGVHAGNNMFAAMFVNYEGSVLPTPSAFIATPNAQTDAWVAIAVLFIIAGVLYKTRKPIIPAPSPVAEGAEVFT